MNSTQSGGQTEPHDVAVAAILQAYENIGHPEQLQRLDKQNSKLEQDVTRHPPNQPNRTAVPGHRPGRGTPLWGITSLLVAACISVTVLAWRNYGDAAKLIIGGWEIRENLRFIAFVGKAGAFGEAAPTHRWTSCSGCITSAIRTSSSDQTGRNTSEGRANVSGLRALTRDSCTRYRKLGAWDRAAQGEPGTIDP